MGILEFLLCPTERLTFHKTVSDSTGRHILNEYETRAWTYQEIAVTKEIGFMRLLGTLEEFYHMTMSQQSQIIGVL